MGVQRGPKIPTDNLWGCWDAASKSSYPGSGTTLSLMEVLRLLLQMRT